MQLTIVSDDNLVTVNGEPMIVNCSDLLGQGIHAVQWNGYEGEIEFKGELRDRKPNEYIRDIERFQGYVDLWALAKAEVDKAKATKVEAAEVQEFRVR